MVDGNPATLVDLSTGGAQVLSATVLKPNQRVRVTLADERGTLADQRDRSRGRRSRFRRATARAFEFLGRARDSGLRAAAQAL